MTLMELLVAVAILVILILIFGMVLSSSQKVITTAQGKMRANSAVAAIAEVFRKDIAMASQHGFLCITQAATADATPQLFLATAGPVASATANEKATGTITAFGVVCNVASGRPVLWRAAWLLKDANAPVGGIDQSVTDIIYATDFARVQVWNRVIANGVVDTLQNPNLPDPAAPYLPDLPPTPTDIDNVNRLWRYLATDCTALDIRWADGQRDAGNNLIWYGLRWDPDPNHQPTPIVVGPTKDAAWASKVLGDGTVEFNAGGGIYRALWTHENLNNWPKAIKIRFRLADPTLPEEVRSAWYEVICPVGQ